MITAHSQVPTKTIKKIRGCLRKKIKGIKRVKLKIQKKIFSLDSNDEFVTVQFIEIKTMEFIILRRYA
jgi:hypothetical protein